MVPKTLSCAKDLEGSLAFKDLAQAKSLLLQKALQSYRLRVRQSPKNLRLTTLSWTETQTQMKRAHVWGEGRPWGPTHLVGQFYPLRESLRTPYSMTV